jgi:transcriptional regulator with XRE-family HTH domain
VTVTSPHEQRRVAARLRAEGATWPEIAAVLRQRFNLAGIAAARQAHGWSQQRAADQWRALWPDDPTSQGALSGWECWPNGGRMPSLRTLERLAVLYEVSASDLLAGWADHRRGDAGDGRRLAAGQLVEVHRLIEQAGAGVAAALEALSRPA